MCIIISIFLFGVNHFKSHYHCVYKLTYHLVLVTKYRKKCFTNAMLNRLEEITKKNCTDWEIELLEFNGEADHIHLLIEMHPNIMPSKFINNLKTVTSRLIRKEFAEELNAFYWKPVLWTRAYCLLTTGGATIETIRDHIRQYRKTAKT
ncbi:putative transposase [Acinetobacter calcoaceticus]|uniref:Putative transposase n=1 Tax=Acinetobacter calcoaceticus TaxID=471 RepID=A0A4R1X3X3_ACICA|nr:putative transposase [Acinetobacter calcoaceticus]